MCLGETPGLQTVFFVQVYDNNTSFLPENGTNYPGQNGWLVQKHEEPKMGRGQSQVPI